MKFLKIILTAVLFVSGLAASAQGRIPLLDKASGHRVSFDYSYLVSLKGEDMHEVTSGKMTVEDNCFSLTGLGLSIISDGESRWTLDKEAKEALVESVDEDDVITNPAILISSYAGFGDNLKVNSSGSDYIDLTLRLDEKSSARFILKNIVYSNPKGEKKDFTLDVKSLGPDYVVTDLR